MLGVHAAGGAYFGFRRGAVFIKGKGRKMIAIKGLRLGMVACACMALGACGTSSSGGAGFAGAPGTPAGGGTPAQALAAFDTQMANGLKMQSTTINPAGKPNYAGRVKLNTLNEGQTGYSGFVVGDLKLQADFDKDKVTGTATNFTGEIDNQAFELTGTLDTANVTSNAPNTVVTSDPMIIAGQKYHVTTMLATLDGKLTNSLTNEAADVELVLTGQAFGANADRIQGSATALVGNKAEVGFGFGGVGEFYVDKK